jgi:CO/xanthine dehydrogenase Mo-binding subunit
MFLTLCSPMSAKVTSSVGYTRVTGGSRVTFATGMAVVEASKKVVDELRARAAMIWDVDVEGVIWEDGQAKPASSDPQGLGRHQRHRGARATDIGAPGRDDDGAVLSQTRYLEFPPTAEAVGDIKRRRNGSSGQFRQGPARGVHQPFELTVPRR